MKNALITATVALALTVALPAAAEAKFQRGPGPKLCPSTERVWNAKKSILGKRLPVARRIAKQHGCTVRVVNRNGNSLVVAGDLRTNRLNVYIRGPKKRVVRIIGVG